MFTHNIEPNPNLAPINTNSIKTYSSISSATYQRNHGPLDIESQIKRMLCDPMHNSSKMRYAPQLDKLKQKTKDIKTLEKQLTSSFAQLGIKMTLNRDIIKQIPELKAVNSTGNDFIKTAVSLIEHYEKILNRVLERDENAAKNTYDVVAYLEKKVNELQTEIDLLKNNNKVTVITNNDLPVQNHVPNSYNEILKLQSVIMMKEKCIQDMKTNIKRKSGHMRYLWLNHKYALKEAFSVSIKLDDILLHKDALFMKITQHLESPSSPITTINSIKDTLVSHSREQPHESHMESSSTTTARRQLNLSFLRSVREFKSMVHIRHKSVAAKQTQLTELEKFIKKEEEGYEAKEFDLKMYKKGQESVILLPDVNETISEKEKQLQLINEHLIEMRNQRDELNSDISKLKEEVKLIYKTNKQKFRNLDFQVRQTLFDFNTNIKTDKDKVIQIKSRHNFGVSVNRRVKHLLKKYKELQSIEDFLYKYHLKHERLIMKVPGKTEHIKISKSVTNMAHPPKNNTAVLTEIESSVEKQLTNFKRVIDQKEGSLFKVSDFIDDLKKLNDLLRKDLEDSQKFALMKSSSSDKLKLLSEGMRNNSREMNILESIDINDITETNPKTLLPSDISVSKHPNKDDGNKKLKSKISEIERMIQSKTMMLEDTLTKVMAIEEANVTLKQQLEEQLKKIKAIYQDSQQRHDLLQDLLKKDKIFDQLYSYQTEKINSKEKKILTLEEKLRDYETQLRNMKKRLNSNNELNVTKTLTNSPLDVSPVKEDRYFNYNDKNMPNAESNSNIEQVNISPVIVKHENVQSLLQKIDDQNSVIRNLEQTIAKFKHDMNQTPFRKSRTVEVGEETDLEDVLKRFDTFNQENDIYHNFDHGLCKSLRSIKNDLKCNLPEIANKAYIAKQRISINKLLTLVKKIGSINTVSSSRINKLQTKVNRIVSNISYIEKDVQNCSGVISVFQKVFNCENIDVKSHNFEYQLSQHLRKLMNSHKRDELEMGYQQMKSINLTLETELESSKTILNRLTIILKDNFINIDVDEDNEIVLEKLQRFLYQKSKLTKELETKNKLIKELKDQISDYLSEIDEKTREIEALEESLKKNRHEMATNKKRYTAEKKDNSRTIENLKRDAEQYKDQVTGLNAAIQEKNVYITQLQKTISKITTHAEKSIISFRHPQYSNEVSMDNIKVKELTSELFGHEKSISIESSKEFFGLKIDTSNSDGFTQLNSNRASKDRNLNNPVTSENKRNFTKKTSDESSPEIVEGLRMLQENRDKEKNIFDESSANLDSILGGKKNLESFQLNSEHSIGNILNTNKSGARKFIDKKVNMSMDETDSFEELLKPKTIDQKEEPVMQKPVKEMNPMSLNDIKLFNFKKS